MRLSLAQDDDRLNDFQARVRLRLGHSPTNIVGKEIEYFFLIPNICASFFFFSLSDIKKVLNKIICSFRDF